MTRARVIGKNRALPWNIPEEYAAFLSHVRGHPVIMGRTSYEIFGPDLPDSPLIVVSRTLTTVAGAEVCSDVASAVERALSHGKPVLLYDLHCPGSQAYIHLAGEILRREEGRPR